MNLLPKKHFWGFETSSERVDNVEFDIVVSPPPALGFRVWSSRGMLRREAPESSDSLGLPGSFPGASLRRRHRTLGPVGSTPGERRPQVRKEQSLGVR